MTRPDEQRQREYKYRFSQSVVFGLPVVALQYIGPRLGPTDSARWVSLLQALLAGWIVYVNLGMLFEGLLLARRRITADFTVILYASLLYLASLVSALRAIVTSHRWYALRFHYCVMILAVWTGLRWWQFARRLARAHRD